jgi:hypothetical protein
MVARGGGSFIGWIFSDRKPLTLPNRSVFRGEKRVSEAELQRLIEKHRKGETSK